jgi:predicted Zn-ribbon and HTH transcriptional regulator
MRKADPKKLAIDLKDIENFLKTGGYEKAVAQRKAEIEAEEKAEIDRIKAIKCPSCKSTSKDHIEKRDDNGIIGPGYSSWIVDEYFVCKKCGTMFKDMEKMKNQRRR